MDEKQLANMYEWDGPDNYLIIVDDDNNVIGTAPFVEVHTKGIRHRAIEVFVFNSNGDMLIQRRGANITYPLLFTSSAGGHVEDGSDYETTAKAEMQEELGLGDLPLEYINTIYDEEQKEFIAVYKTVFDGMPDYDKEELDRVEWMTMDEVAMMTSRFPYLFTGTFLFTYEKLFK